MSKTPQEVFNRINELSKQSKLIHEEINQLMKDFYETYGDSEVPVELEDGKSKYVRIYKPEGRFVYNTEFEMGLRVKPVKIHEDYAKVENK